MADQDDSQQRAVLMTTVTHPSKESIRQYMLDRAAEHSPPPACDAIRDKLHWHVEKSQKELASTAQCAKVDIR